MQSHNRSDKLKYGFVATVLTVGGILFLTWTIINAIQFFSTSNPSWSIKYPFMLSVIGLFSIIYALFHIFYKSWSKKAKNQLEVLCRLDNRVLYEEYGRIFVNDQVIIKLGHDEKALKKLSQQDKRDVFERLCTTYR